MDDSTRLTQIVAVQRVQRGRGRVLHFSASISVSNVTHDHLIDSR